MSKIQNRQRAKRSILINAATLAADNTPIEVDIRDGMHCEVLIAIGAGGITFDSTNKIEFKLTHAPTPGGTYTPVAASDVVIPAASGYAWASGGIIASLVAAHAAAEVLSIDYIGDGGALKLLADFSGTHGAGTPIAAHVALTGTHLSPPL